MAEWLALTKFGEFCVARSGFLAIRGSDATFRDSYRGWEMGINEVFERKGRTRLKT